MANLDVFATPADHEAVVRFLSDATDVRMFESYSRYGRELREFRSFEDLARAFNVGADPGGSGFAVLLELWSPSVESGPRIGRDSPASRGIGRAFLAGAVRLDRSRAGPPDFRLPCGTPGPLHDGHRDAVTISRPRGRIPSGGVVDRR